MIIILIYVGNINRISIYKNLDLINMCNYCNFDVPLHYLLNNAPLLNEEISPANDTEANLEPEFILSRQNIEPAVDSSIEPEEASNELDELTVLGVSTTEDTTSTFEIPDTAFTQELKGDRQYSATLASGETLPDWIAIDSETGVLTFQAEYEQIGNYQILIQVGGSLRPLCQHDVSS